MVLWEETSEKEESEGRDNERVVITETAELSEGGV